MQEPSFTHPTLTLAEAILRVQSRPDISESQRRSKTSALRLFGRAHGGAAHQTIRLDARQAVATMERASGAALGVSKATLRNTRCIFKSVLRDFGILAPVRPSAGPIASPEWQKLLAQVSTSHHPHRLRAFMASCDALDIAPGDVTSQTLADHLAAGIASKGGKNERAGVAEVARLWNHYGETIDDWPQTRLRLQPIEMPRALPLTAYSSALQADVGRFLEGVSPPPIGQLFGNTTRGDDGQIIVRPILSPKTIEARRKGVRSLLWAVVETGTPIADIASLDLLIRADVAERILQWHFTRLGKDQPTAGLAGFLDTLIAIAAYKGLVGPQRTALSSLLKLARPKAQTEMSDKNAGLIAMLEQPLQRKLLLDSPFKLMAEARRIRDGGSDERGVYRSPAPMRAAWLASIAIAIEIELHLPLRVSDLASLNLERDIRRLDVGGGGHRWHVSLIARKNSMRVETHLAGKSAALVTEYVEGFRPLGAYPKCAWLFPHRDQADQPRSEAHFSEAISEQIQRLTGVDMHVHAFRALAAVFIVEATPHALDDIRALLGHKSFETAWRHYMRHNRLAAGARLSETIEQHRRDLLGGR